MVIDAPGIGAARQMAARRRHDVAVAGADIDAGTEQRVVLGLTGIDGDAFRTAEDDMLAAATGHRAPGRRKVVIPLERGERTVAGVARIYVEHHELTGDDARLRLVGEPFPDHGRIGRR